MWAGITGKQESRLWPERMAARTLRLDTWNASRRLAGNSRPEMWNTMVRGAIVLQDTSRRLNDADALRSRRVRRCPAQCESVGSDGNNRCSFGCYAP